MAPQAQNDLGNFIDALLEGLEQLARLEDTFAHMEAMKRPPVEKQRLMYIALEDAIVDFEQATGVTARDLLNKWNKAEK